MNARTIKSLLKTGWYRAFCLLQRAGINVLPEHFYSCVPDVQDLVRRSDWRAPRSMYGIACRDVGAQLELLGEWIAPVHDYLARHAIHEAATIGGGGDVGYGEIEAEVLFAFIAKCRPRRIVQIGCGVSTATALMAAEKARYRPEIICVEPYPSAYLRDAEKTEAIRLIARPAQQVDFGTLADLADGDLLFVDFTHAVKAGSEVNYLIHEVLPRLRSGTWIHFHDIYFPYDYTRDILDGDLFFAQESSLLYAFLSGNARFRIEASLSMVHYGAPDDLRRLIPKYRPNDQTDGLRGSTGRHFPSALWLRVVH